MRKKIKHTDVEDSKEDLSNLETKYLKQTGWKTNSSNPGGLWLWEKEIEGKMYRCSKSTAVFLQSHSCYHTSINGNHGTCNDCGEQVWEPDHSEE